MESDLNPLEQFAAAVDFFAHRLLDGGIVNGICRMHKRRA
jgi:hypothetical protein